MAGSQNHDDEGPGGYASPPCFLHEVDPAYMGIDPQQHVDVARWRKSERARLIEARLAMTAAERQGHAEAIIRRLDDLIGDVTGKTVSAYWPIRGEPDLRAWLESVWQRDGRGALPVVVAKARPLAFRAWRQGDALEKGVWNIPVPADGPDITPDVVISPIVGFDRACYRLGYGGGYFDRTLAAAKSRPLVIGVGYGAMELATIYPQPHDIAMDVIVTERETIGQ